MVKNLPAMQETCIQSLGQEDPLEKGMATTPVFLPGEFHGQRSLASYSLWGCKESDMTEQLTFPSSSSNIPLNIHITVSLSIYPLMETNYFHVLAIINNAAVNTGLHVSYCNIFFSDICPGGGLLDHMVVLFLVF